MEDVNLFGEMQTYFDQEEHDKKERDIRLLKRIKLMVLNNGDYDFYLEELYIDELINPPTFDDFFNKQKEHLLDLYKNKFLEDWDKFEEGYYYTSESSCTQNN